MIGAMKSEYIVKYNLTPNAIIIPNGMPEIVGCEDVIEILGMRVIIDDTPASLAAGVISAYQELIKVMAVSRGLGNHEAYLKEMGSGCKK